MNNLAEKVWETIYPDRRPWVKLEADTQREWSRVVDVVEELVNAQLRSLKLELKESYKLKDSLVKEHLELGETLKESAADRLRLREALERCRADTGERDKVLIHCHVLDQYQEGK